MGYVYYFFVLNLYNLEGVDDVFCGELKDVLVGVKVYHWKKKFKSVVDKCCMDCVDMIKIFEYFILKDNTPYDIYFFGMGFYLCHKCNSAVDLWHCNCPNCAEKKIEDNTGYFEPMKDVFDSIKIEAEKDCFCEHNTFQKLNFSFCPICSKKLDKNFLINETKINWLLFGLGKINQYFFNSWVCNGKRQRVLINNHKHKDKRIKMPFHCSRCQKYLRDELYLSNMSRIS